MQPTLLLGLGRLFDQGAQEGRLKENVLLNGTIFFVNPELRFQVHLTPRWGFYVAPGYSFEARGGAHSQPSQLMTRENSHPNAHIFGVNLGILFGLLPQTTLTATIETKPEKKIVVLPPPPPPAKVEKPKEAVKSPPPAPEEKIIAQVAEIKKELPADQAEKFDREIGKVRDRLSSLKSSLQYIKDGINRTNQIVRRFTETNYQLLREPRLRIPSKDPLYQELHALKAATDLNSDRKPSSLTESSEQIRNGLRVVYPASKGNPLYGERVLYRLERLRDVLVSGRRNPELAREIQITIGTVRKYLKENATPLRLEDLRQEERVIEQSMKGLEPLAKELKLEKNEKWKTLKIDLSQFQQNLLGKVKEAEAFSRLVTLVNGVQNDFIDNVSQPGRAQLAFEKAGLFLGSQGPQKPGEVSWELRKTYSDFFGLLELNLDTFIRRHTPPEERRLVRRRLWFDAIVRARDLLCVIRSDHSMCREKLDPVTEAPRARRIRVIAPRRVSAPSNPAQNPEVKTKAAPPPTKPVEAKPSVQAPPPPPPPPDPGLK
jgi:hypothetical protein